jgi:threonyl-tRNA synthetase
MPDVKLPDGSIRHYDKPVTVAEVAASIGPGLAKAALAGRVNGKLVDTDMRIDGNADVAIVTDKDPDGLEVIRHSSAHLLAHAVKELFPDAQVTIGPVIEDGFYYDFSYKRPFTPEDLAAIEKRMGEIAKRDVKVERKRHAARRGGEVLPRDGRGVQGADHRVHSAGRRNLALPPGRLHRSVPRAPRAFDGKLKVHKLMKVAAPYWRGDSKNEMLQRIYGTAWAKKEDQDAYLHRLEEAEKRDHRKLGRALDLFISRKRRRAWCSGTERLDDLAAGGAVPARRVSRNRLPGSSLPADPRRVAVAALGALGQLPREHVRHLVRETAITRSSR